MRKIGFDNDLYVQKQRQFIRERIERFDGKLYLEFGGKLFDDYHAARVLPGFAPDAKIRLLQTLAQARQLRLRMLRLLLPPKKRALRQRPAGELPKRPVPAGLF